MKRTLIITVFVLAYQLGFSQNTASLKEPPTQSIRLIKGYNRHGSGDIGGILFGTEYQKYITRKVSLSYNIRGTINSSEYTLISPSPISEREIDGSVRFTTAGVQLGVNGGLSMVRTLRHEFMVNLGALARYQSSTHGGYSIYPPQTTGMPISVVAFDHASPQQTVSIGGLFQLQYSYTFKNNIALGITPGFQTDSNGDALLYAAIVVGKRF